MLFLNKVNMQWDSDLSKENTVAEVKMFTTAV